MAQIGERGSDLYLCKTRCQREIETTDRQIDQLVYELYGLTKEKLRVWLEYGEKMVSGPICSCMDMLLFSLVSQGCCGVWQIDRKSGIVGL